MVIFVWVWFIPGAEIWMPKLSKLQKIKQFAGFAYWPNEFDKSKSCLNSFITAYDITGTLFSELPFTTGYVI